MTYNWLPVQQTGFALQLALPPTEMMGEHPTPTRGPTTSTGILRIPAMMGKLGALVL
jgi:hypothetical protein